MDIKEQEVNLWKKWQAGDETAKNDLIRSLDPLLQNQVNKFANAGLPRPAIEAEARKLAIDAFKTYDPSKAALSTHVTNYEKHLQRYVLNYQNIGKIPENRGLQISKFTNIKRNLIESLGREPTIVELADKLSWSIKEVDRMESELRRDLSMISNKEDDYFEDILFNVDETSEIIQFIYYEAPAEEKLILEHTFGMGGKPKLNSLEIAERLNKSEVYVKNIRKKLGAKISELRNMGLIL